MRDLHEVSAVVHCLMGASVEPASEHGIGHVLDSVEDSANWLTGLKANWRGCLWKILFCSGGTKSLNRYQTCNPEWKESSIGRNPRGCICFYLLLMYNVAMNTRLELPQPHFTSIQ